ncbi:C40 family peptidase [Umezawaea sp. Da 62-37]|uniref:C40 family peptidase n=1 Tax=Umezawaea sp. Da 62-37 TaxID=3075927 RepID=UPI0028F71D50|nr:C40 family peptidase [Umezawaea sp. Da 62-37]WNV83158.1 C40 family peptidase [Umezawaea sp. Da 62-37]
MRSNETRAGTLVAGIGVVGYLLLVVPALLVGTALVAGQSGAIAATAECSSAQQLGYGSGGVTQQIADETFTGEQLTNAQTIVTTAVRRSLPKRAAVLALATAMVESGLVNVNYGDRDSLGLFQQRPSQGWGTPAQVLDPVYAANKFFDVLLALPGWPSMPPGTAEQAVQRSGYPDRYAPREPTAAALTDRFWQGPDNPAPPPPGTAAVSVDFAHGGCPDRGGGNLDTGDLDLKKLPENFTLPADPQVRPAVVYALAQLGKPYVWGAAGPESFDCSGLMQAAWAAAQVAISRTTYSQVHDGVAVGSLAQVEPGDLLFIPGSDGTAAAPGHVGMYVGNGYVVDAYDTDHGVILTTLESWKPKVVAIRRIVVGGNGQPPGDDARL